MNTHEEIMNTVAELYTTNAPVSTGIVAREGDRIETTWGTTFFVTHVGTIEADDGDVLPVVYGENPDGTNHGPYYAYEYRIEQSASN